MFDISFRALITSVACTGVLAGCAIAPGYSEGEKEIVQSLESSKFQPASRQTRDNIETQELFAQAAFWSREHELNPGDLESSIKLAAAVRKLGNPGRAVEISQTARALYPRDPYLSAEFAAALIASEQAYAAIKPIDDALRIAPGYARLWSLKGAALDQQEDYDLARKHYARALKITPNDPNIMANVGLSYALSGNPDAAEQWLRRAVSVPGASQGVRQNLALVLQLQGKEAEAEKYNNQPALRGLSAPQSPRQTAQAPRAPQPSYTKPQAYQNRPTYQQPSQNSGIPASERAGNYSQASAYSQAAPQTRLRANSNLAGAQAPRKSAPVSVSDAARLAAQNSTRNKVTVPFDPNGAGIAGTPGASVLDRIANTVGPQASGPLPHRRSLQTQAPVNYPPQYQAQAQTAYVAPRNPQTAQPQNNNGYANYPQRRQAARSRR